MPSAPKASSLFAWRRLVSISISLLLFQDQKRCRSSSRNLLLSLAPAAPWWALHDNLSQSHKEHGRCQDTKPREPSVSEVNHQLDVLDQSYNGNNKHKTQNMNDEVLGTGRLWKKHTWSKKLSQLCHVRTSSLFL